MPFYRPADFPRKFRACSYNSAWSKGSGMDEKTVFLCIAAAIGLWATLTLGRLIVVWLQLMRMRFGPGDMLPVDRAKMPADVAAILDPMDGRLAALGFAYEETDLAEPMLRGNAAQPVWIDVYVHAASGSHASVQIADSPEPGLIAAVTFSTDYDQLTLMTENRRLHFLLPMPASCQLEDAYATTLAEHWAFHCRRLATIVAGTVVNDLETLRQRHRALRLSLFENCRHVGFMRAAGEESRFTARGAWRFLRQVMAGNRRMAALPANAEVEDLELRVLADAHAWQRHGNLTKSNVMSQRGKLLWFALSALAGAAAFGAMTSWTMLPVLLSVLLLHEFGHALAMRAVGYSGLSVLVLPFLGAVAIGRKDDAGPWQKLAVLMAGPLPGLILAILCLRLSLSGPDHYRVLTTIGWLALSINLFNLLPFTPLDGGQIVETFLFSRRPRFRFAFFVGSTAALLAVAVSLTSIPLGAVALLLALAIPGAWRRMRLLAGVEPTTPGETPVHALLKRLHASPNPSTRWPSFALRMQTVRMLLPALSARAPSVAESLVGMTLYLTAIALPIASLWNTGLPQHAFVSLTRASADVAPPDWTQRLAEATTPEARWTVLWAAGQWFEDAEDETQALQYYQQALAEAKGLPDDAQKALHVLDARLAIARYSEPSITRPTYDELIPVLRDLPPAERWRLADVLEALNWLDPQATAATRIERYREAVAVREIAGSTNTYSLLEDRTQLARLLDAQGDTEAAETLLRRNLAFIGSEQGREAVWQIEPAIWFLIAHERTAEAETLLTAQPMPAYNSEMFRSTLAWTHLVQGNSTTARKILSDAFDKTAKQRWNGVQRLMLLLDLIHASADAPDDEARWLEQASALKASLEAEYGGARFLTAELRNREAWEQMRSEARLDAYKRLPGAQDELDRLDDEEKAVKSCKK